MKKLAVCGCSWSAVSTFTEYYGTHWSEIVAKELNLELHNFAVGGVSNFVIRLQIDKVIELKPDLVIISPTYEDRIEFPESGKKETDTVILESICNPAQPKYTSNIKTSALWALTNEGFPGIELYLKHIYSSTVKKQVDKWIIRDGVQQLKMHNIPFLLHPQILWPNDNEFFEFFSGIVTDKNFIPKNESLFYNVFWEKDKKFDPGYHTSPQSQKEFATRLQNFINNIIITP